MTHQRHTWLRRHLQGVVGLPFLERGLQVTSSHLGIVHCPALGRVSVPTEMLTFFLPHSAGVHLSSNGRAVWSEWSCSVSTACWQMVSVSPSTVLSKLSVPSLCPVNLLGLIFGNKRPTGDLLWSYNSPPLSRKGSDLKWWAHLPTLRPCNHFFQWRQDSEVRVTQG